MTTASKPCPICKKPRNQEFHPFCSRGCRDRDLNQWFTDGYAVPGRPAAPEELATQEWDKQD
ncbi:DNA gyrase inhibitor YacG [Altererythrobacter sp. RZ02]|uniref:DNA gyrase inhibitor YacG n=1 Tax=Pontixanthobacter rizhaonensis TaxID=2730337 RepID=A0A848QL69_9SPHN|nr:DNA gyrase inhibitor YacG [Pontixanthobacter rizhaonensis]NMW30935.1 DNA gyrase inhibitor YacG [Pontixanthobacter rizhaonensis]